MNHFREKKKLERTKAHASYVHQKANNENEENRRRFKNPVFANISKSYDKTEVLKKDLIECEKTSTHKSDSINETKTDTPTKTKTKDINLELSKSNVKSEEQ